MFALLLAVIYAAFISLGLPDSLLGSAWPIMQLDLSVPLSFAGIVSMTIAGGTIISSLLSDWLNKKLGTALVTAVSILLTAGALFGFSVSRSFVAICLFAVPYGLGAGAIDAALNNYVALHYSARHMSWLHCFWGVGAAISPYIMGYFLSMSNNWHGGFRTVSVIQLVIAVIVFVSLPFWRKNESADIKIEKPKTLKEVFSIKGVIFILIAFLCYCGAETTAGLWATSYLVLEKGISSYIAAKFASLFYIGITAGRFVCGFVTDKIGDRNMIRIGLAVIAAGTLAVWLPINVMWLPLAGLVTIGVGCAPVYPSIIHSTPFNFGKENSQAIIGVQMASAYVGSTFMPPIFGLIAENISISLYPLYLLVFIIVLFIMTEKLNAFNKNKLKGTNA